jgi:hypothetical protein
LVKTQQMVTLPELAARIRRQCAPTKAELPWLKLAAFGEQRTDKRCLRNNANLRWISGIEADYDLEKISFSDAVDILEQAFLTGIVYTSASHTEGRPRWRVLCPLSLGHPPEQRSRLLARLNGVFGGVFSNESWTLSQAYYYGSVGASPSHRVAETYGHCLDQLDELDADAIGKVAGPRPGGIGAETGPDAFADAELIRQVVTGEVLHPALCALAARYISRGMRPGTVAQTLRGFMIATPEAARDERWRHRFGQIPDLVSSAVVKFSDTKRDAWKNVARVTHRMVQLHHASDAIVEVVTDVAARGGIDVQAAVKMAERICAQSARGDAPAFQDSHAGETRHA